jgi:hypothetical protein
MSIEAITDYENRLRNTTCYLCGAMDRVADGGVTWRRTITPKLKNMGVGVLDPCNKPTEFAKEDKNFRSRMERLKGLGDFESIKDAMSEIAAVDLRMIDIAHFVVMHMDVSTHLCGSYHEAFTAIQQKKPLLVMCEQGVESMPNWMFGVMPVEHMFSSWDELMVYLINVDTGVDTKHHKRWRFFDFTKIYGFVQGEG